MNARIFEEAVVDEPRRHFEIIATSDGSVVVEPVDLD